MEKFKINSARLKYEVGGTLLLNNNFYPIDGDTYSTECKTSESVLVKIESVELDKDRSFVKVVCRNIDDGRSKSLSLRRNGTSINYNEKGKFEHFFTYPNEMSFIVVKVTNDIDGSKCVSEFVVPRTIKSGLVHGIAKLNETVETIFVSENTYSSVEDAMVNSTNSNYLELYNKETDNKDFIDEN